MVTYKYWDRRLIHIVSCLDVEYIICKTIAKDKNGRRKKFKLKTEKDNVVN